MFNRISLSTRDYVVYGVQYRTSSTTLSFLHRSIRLDKKHSNIHISKLNPDLQTKPLHLSLNDFSVDNGARLFMPLKLNLLWKLNWFEILGSVWVDFCRGRLHRPSARASIHQRWSRVWRLLNTKWWTNKNRKTRSDLLLSQTSSNLWTLWQLMTPRKSASFVNSKDTAFVNKSIELAYLPHKRSTGVSKHELVLSWKAA